MPEKSIKSKFYYGYLMVLLGFMVMFVVYVLKSNVTSLFILPITKELGVTRTAYTFNFSIMAITMMISSFFMGNLIKRYKLKYVTPACLLILAISYLLFSKVNSLTHIYILAAVQGLAYGGATTLPVNIMVNNWFGASMKGKMMSLASLGSGVGALVWINLFRVIIEKYSWRGANVAIAIVYIVLMIPLIYFIAVDRPEEKGYDYRPGDPKDFDNSVQKVSVAKIGIEFKKIWSMPRFYLQSLGQILIVACASAITSQSVPYFQDLGMSPAAAAALYSGALGTLMFGKFILGFISDLITVRRAALFAPVMFMCTFLSLYFMGGMPEMSKVFIATYMIGGSISTIIPPLLTAKNYGDKDFGSIMGVITMEGNIGQIIGPLLASFIFDTTGSYKSAWIIYASLTLIVGLAFFFSTKLSKNKAKEYGYE